MRRAMDPVAEQVAAACRRLAASGMAEGTSGNVSARERATGRWWVTRTGLRLAEAQASDVIEVAGAGDPPDGVSSEWRMHAALYRNPRCAAVVHTHPVYATALSCLGEGLPPFHYAVLTLGRAGVPCTPYAPFGSNELAGHASEALAGASACLLGQHGAVTRGATLDEAVERAERLEHLAHVYLAARATGAPVRSLSPDQVEEAARRLCAYGTDRDAGRP